MKLNYRVLLSLLILLYCFDFSFANEEKTFRVASYNVENLFDLTSAGTEYDEYVPGSNYFWDERSADIKYSNIAKVISGLKSDIVALQEVESFKALLKLRKYLSEAGCEYPFGAISEAKNSVVKCALLSKFQVINYKELCVNKFSRSILRTEIDVFGSKLIVYVNHWQSKRKPESTRIEYARVLKRDIETLSPDAEFVVLGDLNSDYNEFVTFRGNIKLNNTSGTTGINHILKTIVNSQMVEKKMLIDSSCNKCLYNLWLEIDSKDRWSYIFFDKKGSLDNIIIPASLCDQKKISYIDNSFRRFTPSYLFKRGKIYRWQRTKNGFHKGEGFSDHLPVYADFKVEDMKMSVLPEN